MKPDVKKLLILNLPYLIFVYLFAKCGEAYRLAAGADLSGKLLHFADGFAAAFANPLPSLHLFDLCIGIAGAVIVRLVVYCKSKNVKKYRKGMEYGSARWRGMGQGYLKSLLALGFQAFLIMVVVGIYAVLIQNIGSASDISGAIWGCMGYTVLLCFCLFKTGSISKAVFGAH